MNKPYTLKEHGDPLEQNHADFIVDKIPSYQRIWSIYIGNDGNAHLPKIDGISELHQKRRSDFSEAHYTCLESILCMKRIMDKTVEATKNSTQSNELDFLNDFMAFHAQAGRARDNIFKENRLIEGYFTSQEQSVIKKRFAQFVDSRNALLHSTKLPASYVNGVYFITIPSEIEALRAPYYNQTSTEVSPWGFAQNYPQYVKEINDYYSNYFKGLYEEFEDILEQIAPKIEQLLSSNNYVLPEPTFVPSQATTSSGAVFGVGQGVPVQIQMGISRGSGSGSIPT